MENPLTFEMQHRYLHDAAFHALVHQIIGTVKAHHFTVDDIRDAVVVAEFILQERAARGEL